MCFHKVPEYDDPLNISVIERIVVVIFSVAVNHLLPPLTATPASADPPMHPVHVCVVLQGVWAAPHPLPDSQEVLCLYVIVPTILSYHRTVRSWAKITRSSYRVWYGTVMQSMHADDVDRGGGEVVEPPHGRAAHWSYRRQ